MTLRHLNLTAPTITFSGALKQKRKPKYRNQITRVDGYAFDSKAEANRYHQLVLLQRGRVIEGLLVHPRYPLTVEGALICVYEGDFSYMENRQAVVEDVKGFATDVYKLKAKLFKALYPGIKFVEVKA